MAYLILKACDLSRKQIPAFRNILELYDVEISANWENRKDGTIELIINARNHTDWVKSTAMMMFENEYFGFWAG
jgi:hypothetical protein